jgi:pimeloyl-ACP methyl ester carboxylesterase
MTSSSFRQTGYLLGGVYTASSMAKVEGFPWPPPPAISLLNMLRFIVGKPMQVTSVDPDVLFPEPCAALTSNDLSPGTGYVFPPAELGQPVTSGTPGTGRLADKLISTAKLRDGNNILLSVADTVISNAQNPATAVSDVMLTAMTQLAVTGSNAFAAWANPTPPAHSIQEQDLTSYLFVKGMDPVTAGQKSQQIMADFHAAEKAIRNAAAGVNASSLRAGIPAGAVSPNAGWIAVSGEDDSPDFPVNVRIAPYPQYHATITVPTPSSTTQSSLQVSIRFIVASSQNADPTPCGTTFQGSVPDPPSIPPGNEVVIYIHGEGSRAEEALDFIPALFKAGGAVGRSFTVIAFDQPGTAYSSMTLHNLIAPMPSYPVVDTSTPTSFPILQFVYDSIATFVETTILPFGNPITAVVGGSLGGHLALRFAASQKDWVRNVVAWSPAGVFEHDFTLLGISFPHTLLSNNHLAGQMGETREQFLADVFDNPAVDITPIQAGGIAAALIAASVFPNAIVALGAVAISGALLALPHLGPEPSLWWRPDWPGIYAITDSSRFDRQEVCCTAMRDWHFRICLEMVGYNFFSLRNANPSQLVVTKPLLLLVGEKDDNTYEHFYQYVPQFAKLMNGLGQCLTVKNTGHSIHNERPFFLAQQIVKFCPRP